MADNILSAAPADFSAARALTNIPTGASDAEYRARAEIIGSAVNRQLNANALFAERWNQAKDIAESQSVQVPGESPEDEETRKHAAFNLMQKCLLDVDKGNLPMGKYDPIGTLWKDRGFKSGTEAFGFMAKFLKDPDSAITEDYKHFKNLDYAAQVEEAKRVRGTFAKLKSAVGDLVEDISNFGDEPVLSSAEDKIAPDEVKEANKILKWRDEARARNLSIGQSAFGSELGVAPSEGSAWNPTEEEKARVSAAEETVGAFRQKVKDEAIRSEYEGKLLKKNAWAILPQVISSLRSEGAKECARAILESEDKALSREMEARARGLTSKDRQTLAQIRNLAKPEGEDTWATTAADAAIGFANTLVNIGTSTYRMSNRWSTEIMNELFDLGLDIEEDMRTRQELYALTGSFFTGGDSFTGALPELQFEQICTDHGVVGDALVGAISTLPYMYVAGRTMGNVNVGMVPVALDAMNQFDEHTVAEGGDITNPGYIVRSFVLGGLYAYVEKLQLENLLGGVSEMGVRKGMLKSMWAGIKNGTAPKVIFSTTLNESVEEGLQASIMAFHEALALDKNIPREMTEAFVEDFINSLGTMALIGAGGLVLGHAKRSGWKGGVAGLENRSADLTSAARNAFAIQALVRSNNFSDEAKLKRAEREIFQYQDAWKEGGVKALLKSGLSEERANELDELYKAEREARENEADEAAAKKYDDRLTSELEKILPKVTEDLIKANNDYTDEERREDFEASLEYIKVLRDAWARGKGVVGELEEGEDGRIRLKGTDTDPGAAALQALGLTEENAKELSLLFHRERANAYSSATIKGIRDLYEKATANQVTPEAALASEMGGRLETIDGENYIRFKQGLVKIVKRGNGLVDSTDTSDAVATSVEEATKGRITVAQWQNASAEQRKEWASSLIDEGGFFVEAGFDTAIKSSDANKILGTIRMSEETPESGIVDKFAPLQDSSAIFHETFHAFARFMNVAGVWTDEDLKKLTEKYGKAREANETFNEESAANAFRDYLRRRMAGAMKAEDESNTVFAKLFSFASSLRRAEAAKKARAEFAKTAEEAFFDQVAADTYKELGDLNAKPKAPETPKPTEKSPTEVVVSKKETTTPESTPSPTPTQTPTPTATRAGAATTGWSAATPTGNVRVGGSWRVFKLSDLIHSNNPLYAKFMRNQLRNRVDNKAEESKREEIINNFDPARLFEAPDTANGAPIVFLDKDDEGIIRPFVLSGNGRVLVLNTMADRHLFDKYRNFMRNWAKENGLEVPDGDYVVVRVIEDYGGATREQVADLSNTNSIQQYTEEEQARADAEVIKNLDLARLYKANQNGSADMTPGANDEFFRGFINGVGDTSLLNSDGSVTETARVRAVRALLAIAVGQGDRGRDVVKKLIEQTDTLSIVRQKNAAVMMAAAVASLENNAAYSIGPDVSRAMADFIDFAEKKKAGKISNFADYYAQLDLIDGPSEVARGVLGLFGTNKGALEIAEYVNKYVETAKVSDADGGLFGADAARTKTDIWNDVKKLLDEKGSELKKPETEKPIGSERLSISSNLFAAVNPYYEGDVRDVVLGVKAKNERAIRIAAASMAKFVREGDVLVPVPGHLGHAEDTLALAEAISSITGTPVVDALKSPARESVYEQKKLGVLPSAESLGIVKARELPADRRIVLLDNVVGTGTTAYAAREALGGGQVLAFAYDVTSPVLDGLNGGLVECKSLANVKPVSEREAKDIIAGWRAARKTFTNKANGRVAEVKSDWSKIFSSVAKGQSDSYEAHYAAAANLGELYENGVKMWSEPPRNKSADIAAYSKYGCPFYLGETPYLAKITIKEYADTKMTDGFYSIEAIEVEKINAEGNNVGISKVRGHELDLDIANSLSQLLREVNAARSQMGVERKSVREEPRRKQLLAIHNMSLKDIKNIDELGGFAMPSIAVVKDADGHKEFGEVSVLFDRNTIDPKKNRQNALYSHDAWTPTFPEIYNKIDEKGIEKVNDDLRMSLPEALRSALSGEFWRFLYKDGIHQAFDQAKDAADAYAYDVVMKAAYLVSKGEKVDVAYKDVRYHSKFSNDELKAIHDKFGDRLNEIRESAIKSDEREDAYREIFPELKALLMKLADSLPGMAEKNAERKKQGKKTLGEMLYGDVEYGDDKLDFWEISTLGEAVHAYITKGDRKEVDTYATREAIDKRVDPQDPDYRAWINAQYENPILGKGVYNGKGRYTPSGAPRKWDALHDTATLENIVKAMKKNSRANGVNTVFGRNPYGVAVRKFSSLKELVDNEGLLKPLSREEEKAIKEELNHRLMDLGAKYMESAGKSNHENQLIAFDRAMDMIYDAWEESRGSRPSFLRLLNSYAYSADEKLAGDIMDVLEEISMMPTNYFEAKPQRAVGFDETRAWIVPDTISAEDRKILEDRGQKILTYKAGDEEDRLRVINAAADEGGERFSFFAGVNGVANMPNALFITGNRSFAREMLRGRDWTKLSGDEKRRIKAATGWEIGADGKWRYEIDDLPALPIERLKNPENPEKGVMIGYNLHETKYAPVKLGDLWSKKDKKAIELFRAYPWLKDITVGYGADLGENTRGSYYESDNVVLISEKNRPDPAGVRETLTHELQHAIQHFEDFARGGNVEASMKMLHKRFQEAAKAASAYLEEIKSYISLSADREAGRLNYRIWLNRNDGMWHQYKASSPEVKAATSYLKAQPWWKETEEKAKAIRREYGHDFRYFTNGWNAWSYAKGSEGFDTYHRLAGEVEARNAAKRIGKKGEGLIESTEDVDRKSQILINREYEKMLKAEPEAEERHLFMSLRGGHALGITPIEDPEAMEARGESRDEIYRKTGWWRAADGKWRVELPFTGKFNGEILKDLNECLLRDVFAWPELYAAYPSLRETRVSFESSDEMNGAWGEWEAAENTIHIWDGLRDKIERRMHLVGTFIHEMQHAVQELELLAPGGNPAQFEGEVDAADRYNRLAGEVEARNAAERILMTASAKLAYPPWVTQDTSDTDQIVTVPERYSIAEIADAPILDTALDVEDFIKDKIRDFRPGKVWYIPLDAEKRPMSDPAQKPYLADAASYATFTMPDLNKPFETAFAEVKDGKERYSITMDKTRNLIAVHGLRGYGLKRAVKAGGLVMPSLAIVDAHQGWSQAGYVNMYSDGSMAEVFLMFPRSIVDTPTTDVYQGDAFTPTINLLRDLGVIGSDGTVEDRLALENKIAEVRAGFPISRAENIRREGKDKGWLAETRQLATFDTDTIRKQLAKSSTELSQADLMKWLDDLAAQTDEINRLSYEAWDKSGSAYENEALVALSVQKAESAADVEKFLSQSGKFDPEKVPELAERVWKRYSKMEPFRALGLLEAKVWNVLPIKSAYAAIVKGSSNEIAEAVADLKAAGVENIRTIDLGDEPGYGYGIHESDEHKAWRKAHQNDVLDLEEEVAERFSIHAWPENFPRVPSLTTRTYVEKNYHDLFVRGKAGSLSAAVELVNKIVERPKSLETVKALAAAHPNAVYIPVIGVEASGENAIPYALARVLSQRTPLDYTASVRMIDKPHHTGKDRLYRLQHHAFFKGPVMRGREYIIVDDHITSGATIRDLKNYITERGGKVVAATTLTFSRYSAILSISDESKLKLRQSGITDELLRRKGIAYGIEDLTESEAQFLYRVSDPRGRIASLEDNSELGERGRRNPRPEEGTSANGSGVGGAALSRARRSGILLSVDEIKDRTNPDTGKPNPDWVRWAEAKTIRGPISLKFDEQIDRLRDADPNLNDEESHKLITDVFRVIADTEEVKKISALSVEGYSFHKREDEINDPVRQKKWQEIHDIIFAPVVDLKNNPDLKKRFEKGTAKPYTPVVGHEAHIVVGPPAAGKSSVFVVPLSLEHKARVIDADIIKPHLPGFADGNGAGYVHEESSYLNKKFLNEAMGTGVNLVVPIVGSDEQKLINDYINPLHAAGYKIYIHNNIVPIAHATGRALCRTLSTGRWLSPNLFTSVLNKPTAAFEAVKNLVEGWDAFSNDVGRRELPIFLGASEGYVEKAYEENIKLSMAKAKSLFDHAKLSPLVKPKAQQPELFPAERKSIVADPNLDARRAIRADLQDNRNKVAENVLVNYVTYFKLAHGTTPRHNTIAKLGLAMGMNLVSPGKVLKRADELAEKTRGSLIEKAAGNGDVETAMALLKRQNDLDHAINNLVSGGVAAGGQLTHLGVGTINQTIAKRVEQMMKDFSAATLADMEGETGLDIAAEILANNPDAFDGEVKKAKGLDNEKPQETGDDGEEGGGDAGGDEGELSDYERFRREEARKAALKKVEEFIAKAKARAEENRRKAEERRENAPEGNFEGGSGDGSESGGGSGDKNKDAPENTVAGFKSKEEFAAFMRVWAEDRFNRQHGNTTLGKTERDKLFAEFYRITVRQELQDLADKLLAPRGARAYVNRRIAEFEKGLKPDTIERMSANIFAFINKAAIRESRNDLVKKFKKELKEKFLKGKNFEELKLDADRRVTGWVEEATRYIARVCDLSRREINGEPSQLAKERKALLDILEKRSRVYDESGKEVASAAKEDLETKKALWKLALLDKYGAMTSLMPGEILDLQDSAFQYLEEEAVKLEQLWADARRFEDEVRVGLGRAIQGPKGQRYQEKGLLNGRLFDALNGMIRLRLKHLTRFAPEKLRTEADRAINKILVLLGDGETAYNRQLQEDRAAFFKALGGIFTTASGRPDATKIRAYLNRMTETVPVELSRKISNQGFAESMTWGQALQLLVSIEQRSFKDAVKENGREGQAEEIRKYLSLEDIKFVDWLRAFYAAKRETISPVLKRMVGLGVDSPDPLYCPVKRWMGDRTRDLHSDPSPRWDAIGSVFSRRVENLRDFDETASVIGMFFNRSDETAKLVAWAERGTLLRGIFTSQQIQTSIRNAFGPAELGKILKQLEATFNGGESKSKTPGELAAVDKALNFTTYAYLGFNPLSAAKQTTSFTVWANALPGGFKDLWKYMTHFDRDALKHLKESDEYKVRYGNDIGSGQDMATKGLNENPSANPVVQMFTGASMWLLKKGDFVPGGWIAQGVYKDRLDMHLQEGMEFEAADKLAITETFNLLEETQQSGRTYNTNMLTLEHGRIGRMLTQFATSALQQLQYETQAYREYRDMKRYKMGEEKIAAAREKLLRAVVINHLLLPAAMNFVAAVFKAAVGAPPPWEEEGWHWTLLTEILLGQFSRIFFVGVFSQTALTALFKRETPRAGQMLPVEGSLGMVTSVMFTAHDVATLNSENLQKDLRRILKSTAPTRLGLNVYENYFEDKPKKK